MKSKNLMIIGTWIFLITIVIGFFIYEIGITFASYLVLFSLGAGFSILTLYLPDK